MRASTPDVTDVIIRDGVTVAYELYDNDAPTLLLFPTWAIVHARVWKGQLAYLTRHWRVITFDGRGNGRSDRPRDPAAYSDEHHIADALAILDTTGTSQAVAVGWSRGAKWAAYATAMHPDRILGAFVIAPGIPFTPHPHITADRLRADIERPEGWDKFSVAHWRRDWSDFVDFFHHQVFAEPHASKQIEDAIAYSHETTPDVVAATMAARLAGAGDAERLIASISRPVTVVHARGDRVNPYEWGARTAEHAGGDLVTVEGASHGLPADQPVFVNRLIDEFARRVTGADRRGTRRWTRARSRPKRALYLSSPIGLGHVRRDLAIARELSSQVDGLQVDWLTQPPVTDVVKAAGQTVHPASRWLVSESAHIDDEAGEHDLNVFEAFRRMDEIMVANFHLFQEVVEDGTYDLVIADEAWDVDLFWHHNPELKRCPLAWLTDFVGFLPAAGEEREAALTADYNAEMLELVERYGRIRDRAIFVGDEADVVAERFGPGLPVIRDWTRRHFEFSGYITGFDPADIDDVEAIRHDLGYRPDERICIVSVGGSGAGADLLRRVVEAYPAAAERIPGLRMIAVAGPRIDPRSLAAPPGVEVRAYVPDLHRHLAVCDLAVVQGGLTTTMELTAARRPFLYFPLQNHFEQRIHVRHRLDRHRAGRMMEYRDAKPDLLADAMAAEISRIVDFLPVPDGGAARAARSLACLF